MQPQRLGQRERHDAARSPARAEHVGEQRPAAHRLARHPDRLAARAAHEVGRVRVERVEVDERERRVEVRRRVRSRSSRPLGGDDTGDASGRGRAAAAESLWILGLRVARLLRRPRRHRREHQGDGRPGHRLLRGRVHLGERARDARGVGRRGPGRRACSRSGSTTASSSPTRAFFALAVLALVEALGWHRWEFLADLPARRRRLRRDRERRPPAHDRARTATSRGRSSPASSPRSSSCCSRPAQLFVLVGLRGLGQPPRSTTLSSGAPHARRRSCSPISCTARVVGPAESPATCGLTMNAPAPSTAGDRRAAARGRRRRAPPAAAWPAARRAARRCRRTAPRPALTTSAPSGSARERLARRRARASRR